MESLDKYALKSEVGKLRIALLKAKEKIFEYQEGKEEIDGALVGALYWIERGLFQGGDDAPQN